MVKFEPLLILAAFRVRSLRFGYPLTITVSTGLGLLVTVLIGLRWRASVWQGRPEPTAAAPQRV